MVTATGQFVYRDGPRALRRVSRELGLRDVVEGGVRARAGRVRATAQMIDALTGGQIWAETFDRDLAGPTSGTASKAGNRNETPRGGTR